jgi:prophage endopeptidase
MKFKFFYGVVGALIIALAVASVYYSKYKKQLDISKNQATEIQQLTDTINIQNSHIQMMQELDTKHTQELAHAKTEIDTLRTDVAAGRRKLRIKAICSVPETASSGGMVYAATPQLTESAKQDYYDLLRMMAENGQQTKYLQDYIKTECRGNDGKHR